MFEELTEKINALSTGLDITYKFDNGFVECQRRVIEILEEFKPQPQDKPDSEGWWWLINPELDDIPLPLYINTNSEGILLIFNAKGKWYRAILPEDAK